MKRTTEKLQVVNRSNTQSGNSAVLSKVARVHVTTAASCRYVRTDPEKLATTGMETLSVAPSETPVNSSSACVEAPVCWHATIFNDHPLMNGEIVLYSYKGEKS